MKETVHVGKELKPMFDENEQMKQEIIKQFDELKTVVTETIQHASREKKEQLKRRR